MQTQIFSNPLTATIAVGSGVLLGHWSLLNLLIELLSALGVGTLIVCSLQSKHPLLNNMALFISNKISRVLMAIWAKFPWHVRRWLRLRFLECRMLFRIFYIRLNLIAYKMKLIAKHGRNWRVCVFDDDVVKFLELVEYVHKNVKWPNEKS